MSASRLRRPIVAFLVATPALLCGSCSDEVTRKVSPFPMATTPARDWRTGESALVRHFEVPAKFGSWRALSKQREIVPAPDRPDEARAVHLTSKGKKHLVIPLDAEMPEFNQVSLSFVVDANSAVSVQLRADDEVLCRSVATTVFGRPYAQHLTIDLLTARMIDVRPDELRVTFSAGTTEATCWDIEAKFRPWESWTADLSRADRRPTLSDVARPARVIATDNPHSARFEVPENGVLQFSYGGTPLLTSRTGNAVLRLDVASDAASRSFEFDVSGSTITEVEWHTERVDLADFAGDSVLASFTLLSQAPIADYALLSSLDVFVPVDQPRTVLFVTSDTHRADHVATISGSVAVRTPTLDALGSRGVIFDDCYSSTNITVPSHVALLTATPPRDTLVLDNMSGIAEEARTLAESFRESGYATLAAVSGSQLQDAWSGLGQGFDAMACPPKWVWAGDRTLEALEGLLAEAEGRDTFIWLHFFDVHQPYDEENRFLPQYWPADRDPYDASLPEPEFPPEAIDHPLIGVRDREYMDANYKAEVTFVDHLMARLLERPRIANGVIAVTADHGECLGEHGVWWDHAGLYPKNLHVPLILAGPGVPEGRRVTGPVGHLDIGRTLLDLAGLSQTPFPGESMLIHVDEAPDERTPRFALAARATAASVEMDGWFCVLNLSNYRIKGIAERKLEHAVELFHLRSDTPDENLAVVDVDRARRMRALILDWLGRQERTDWVSQGTANEAERIEQVKALGYTGESADGDSIWIDPDCECESCTVFGPH